MDTSAGRGRGRGRGAGVPVLPSGMWDEMQGNENSVRASDNDDTRDNDKPDMSRFNDAGRGKVRPFEKDAKGADWECTACSNINWSWRASCNRCGNAKPITLLTSEEIRDGVGGGFNEYQERVSAANVEITEDGFDDFGRRAKSNTSNKSAKELAALERLQKNYGFLMGSPAPAVSTTSVDEVKPKYATSAKEREKYNTVAQPLPTPEVVVSKAALAREEAKKEAKEKASDKHNRKKTDDRHRTSNDQNNNRTSDGRQRRDTRSSRSRDRRSSRERSRERSRDRRDRSRERHRSRDRYQRDRSRERRR